MLHEVEFLISIYNSTGIIMYTAGGGFHSLKAVRGTAISLTRSIPRLKKDRVRPFGRLFHTTQQPHLQWLDVCFHQTHTVLTGLHEFTGLPWAWTLPLTALLIRSLIFVPIGIYTHRNRERIIAVQPLSYAWHHILQRKVFKEHAALGPDQCTKILNAELKLKAAELKLKIGARPWKGLLPWLQLPVWLVVIETIRKMSGTHEGLLGLVTKNFKTPVEQDRETALEALGAPSIVPVEQSFSTEGALWFTDLVVPDPQLILPFLLSGTLFANIYYQTSYIHAKGITQTKWNRRLTNSLKLVALAVGPLTLQVPSAMLVYWISSSALATAQSVILDRSLRTAPRITPCKPRQSLESPVP